MIRKPITALLLLSLVIIAVFGCTSRLKTNLFVEHKEELKKVSVEKTELIKNSQISDPFADNKITTGNEQTAIITISTRWGENQTPTFSDKLLAFDKYWKARLYFELPEDSKPAKIDFQGNTLMHLLGHFHWKPEEKIFLPQSGFYTIDSLNGDKLFITVDGQFKNEADMLYKISGNYKIKVK